MNFYVISVEFRKLNCLQSHLKILGKTQQQWEEFEPPNNKNWSPVSRK